MCKDRDNIFKIGLTCEGVFVGQHADDKKVMACSTYVMVRNTIIHLCQMLVYKDGTRLGAWPILVSQFRHNTRVYAKFRHISYATSEIVDANNVAAA